MVKKELSGMKLTEVEFPVERGKILESAIGAAGVAQPYSGP